MTGKSLQLFLRLGKLAPGVGIEPPGAVPLGKIGLRELSGKGLLDW